MLISFLFLMGNARITMRVAKRSLAEGKRRMNDSDLRRRLCAAPALSFSFPYARTISAHSKVHALSSIFIPRSGQPANGISSVIKDGGTKSFRLRFTTIGYSGSGWLRNIWVPVLEKYLIRSRNYVEQVCVTAFLVSGSILPALVPGKIRLYSMRFCPYAQRIHLVLDAKQIP